MKLSKVVSSLGTLSVMNFARKHREKLLSSNNTAVAALAARVDTALSPLEAAYAARRPLTALWREATAAKDAADDELDSFIAALSYDLLSPSNLKGDRAHPSYRGLFPEGNIAFISGPDRVEVVQVNAMAAYLKNNPNHPMADRVTQLETLAAGLDAALGPVVSAESALRQAQALEREKRSDLRRALRKSAALLRAELMDEKQVDALFPSVEESKVTEDAEDVPTL